MVPLGLVVPAGKRRGRNVMIDRVQRLYGMLIHLSSSLESPFLLAVRLYWGWQFIQTGWGHLTHLDKVISYFTELVIPAPAVTATFVSTLELVGGVLLVIGFAGRLIGLMLTVNMLVAYITASP